MILSGPALLPGLSLWGRVLRCCLAMTVGILVVGQGAWAKEEQAQSLQDFIASGARVSALVQDLDSGKTILDLGSSQRLSPASVSKLVIAAVALQTWKGDKVFSTRVLAAGPIREGRIEGDLVVNGDGDATFDHRDLWLLAGQLRAAGLRHVGGAVVVEPALGPFPCENIDRCEALVETRNAYDVPMSAIAVDYGAWCIDLIPTEPGAPATVRSCSGAALPIPMDGVVTTTSHRRSSYQVRRRTEDGIDRLELSGEIAMRGPRQVYRSMSDPALGLGQLLTQMLREQGITVAAEAYVRYGVTPFEGEVLAAVAGLPLREQLGRMNRYSNNYIADLLTLTVATERTASRPDSLSSAAQGLGGFLQGVNESANPPRLYSGSGLTPESEMSARDVVGLLEYMYRDTSRFPVFYGGLTVPEQSPFAFLAEGNEEWRHRVAVKTGTLTEPDPVRAVAGYIRKKSGGWMAFAVLVNGKTAIRAHNNPRFMDAIRAEIEGLLTRY